MNYACTARKTTNPITKQHYLDYLDKISDLGTISCVNFEETKGLHCHFTITVQGKLDYNTMRPTKKGWNVKVVPIYDRQGWIRYSRKDQEGLKTKRLI